MEQLSDRAVFMLLGMLIGLVAGYMIRLLQDIRKGVRDVDTHVQEAEERLKDEGGYIDWSAIWARFRSLPFTRIGVALAVLLTAFAAFQAQVALNQAEDNLKQLKVQEQIDSVKRCRAGVDGRNVQRALVDEIYRLNLSFIDPKQTYTQKQSKQIQKFLLNTAAFRMRMYKQITPSPLCAPYVTDDNLKPPHIPVPVFKVKGARS